MITHYIPPFTRINGRKQETVCFLWITAAEHSNEPTCEACQKWMDELSKDTRTADEVFGEDSHD